ncbi:prepilin-type N-terminal cleavage/methylation domain-containing protein [Aneurinibacillus sp. BA2021]|nr:prepilin-type N-terminal cleavage/methylation domain-containing protein [Aneurinibacillus sp. BA2021]
MKSQIRKTFSLLKTEHGLTLIETLVAVAIFLLIIIPISSYYLSGISVFQRTQTQTNLRNEADFVLANILNTIQNATYFDLQQVSDEEHKKDLLSIFEKSGTFDFSNASEEEQNRVKNTLSDGIFTYTLTLNKDNISKLERKKYRFPSDSNYLVDGLFRLSDDNTKLMIYLVVAPKNTNPTEENQRDRNGEKMEFHTIEEIADEIHSRENDSLHYIRLIRTEFSVNNFNGGR